MKRIFKYGLPATDIQTVQLPRGAHILCVQAQEENPNIWAMVDPSQPVEDRTFVTVGTGHPVPNAKLEYVGTYQLQGGALVFHVFEMIDIITTLRARKREQLS